MTATGACVVDRHVRSSRQLRVFVSYVPDAMYTARM